ncbi:MAG: peptidoglycan synthetase [Saprospiraceae bacterium]|nr:peptidoglycan synthetase [Saprospiraceae bacterium]
MNQKVHLIAIGGSIMHNLALALHSQGFIVSGSDDQIYEPARSRLGKRGICPEKEGWWPENINNDLSFVILGMHAKGNNPELLRALELGLKVYSFPEFVAEYYKDSHRIVLAGSHGKTTTTSMLMHVFKELNLSFDYLVGAQIEGFDEMVSLHKAEYALIEGDEYLSSCLDPRPKIMHYSPQIAIITGIAWDHYNVFPKFELYTKAFADFISSMPASGTLFWYQGDDDLQKIVSMYGKHIHCIPYGEPEYVIQNEKCYLISEEACYPLEVIGKHNLQNMNSVLKVCHLLGFNSLSVCEALSSFKGAAKRMQLLKKNDTLTIYQDFAHAPSKVKATINALKETFPGKTLTCFLELHTYSSLNNNFLPQYADTCNKCDKLTVYYDKKALEIKNMENLDPEFVASCFNIENIDIIHEGEILKEKIAEAQAADGILVFLGSGNWNGNKLYQE